MFGTNLIFYKMSLVRGEQLLGFKETDNTVYIN
jgi:hypothetical protein